MTQQKVGRGREGKRRRHKGNTCREGVMGREGKGTDADTGKIYL